MTGGWPAMARGSYRPSSASSSCDPGTGTGVTILRCCVSIFMGLAGVPVWAVTPAKAKQIRVLGVGTCLRLACAVFVVVLIVISVEAPRLPTKMTIMIAAKVERRSRPSSQRRPSPHVGCTLDPRNALPGASVVDFRTGNGPSLLTLGASLAGFGRCLSQHRGDALRDLDACS